MVLNINYSRMIALNGVLPGGFVAETFVDSILTGQCKAKVHRESER
jgi:hypothetical protein